MGGSQTRRLNCRDLSCSTPPKNSSQSSTDLVQRSFISCSVLTLPPSEVRPILTRFKRKVGRYKDMRCRIQSNPPPMDTQSETPDSYRRAVNLSTRFDTFIPRQCPHPSNAGLSVSISSASRVSLGVCPCPRSSSQTAPQSQSERRLDTAN